MKRKKKKKKKKRKKGCLPHLNVQAHLHDELLLQGARDGRLAAAAEPRHPHGGALLADRLEALLPRQVARLLAAPLARLDALIGKKQKLS